MRSKVDNEWGDMAVYQSMTEVANMVAMKAAEFDVNFAARSTNGIKRIRRAIDKSGEVLLDAVPMWSWRNLNN